MYNVISFEACYFDITLFEPIIIHILVTYIDFHIPSFEHKEMWDQKWRGSKKSCGEQNYSGPH